MKPNEAARILGIAASTIRAWTMNEYREFFSPGAQGGDGRARDINEQDVQILHYIDLLKRRGMHTDEVIASLRQAKARGWRDLPPMPDVPVGVASVPVVPTAAADAAINGERRALLREITMLQEQIEKLETRLEGKTEETERLRTSLITAERELAAAERELELWRAGRLKPDDT